MGDAPPSYTEWIRHIFNQKEQKKMYIGDFIEEDGFEYDSDSDVETNNSQLLFHILESRFDIKIPQPIKELLLRVGDSQDPKVISDFIETIQDEETKVLLKKMKENGEIKSVNEIKDVLFIRTIIEQAYRERALVQEKNNIDDKDIEFT